MDLSKVDIHELAPQLRKPEGEYGKNVGTVMAQYNGPAIAFTFECLQVQPADHILEIGFGPGEGIAEAVRLTPNGYVAGIDHSHAMFQMAGERNHRAIMQEHVELTVGTASELPYEDESFHKLFAINVFHFWADPSKELAECKRVLRPGGRLVFYLVHPSSWPKGLAETGIFTAREPQESEKLLRDAGFQNVESRIFTHPDGKGYVVLGMK